MRTVRKRVTTRDLVDEAKKRIVFLLICVVGLSYAITWTSSSVLVNLPAAAFLIIIFHYLTFDYDMRRKATLHSNKPSSANGFSQGKPAVGPKLLSERSEWKRKVNSPIVEDAIDHFTRHIVSEWVTDLWYSRITPDKQGPEELVLIINGVLGEISARMKNINIIDILTRDIIKLFCSHLELFRACQTKIEKLHSLTTEQRDIELKNLLYSENNLHPALFSAGAEYKVLQHLMDGLIPFTFKPEDLQCSLFHYIVREILSCAVMRPVVNLANPRFINERIESMVVSARLADKGANTEQGISEPNRSLKKSKSQSSQLPDPTVKGVELKQLSRDKSDSTTSNVNSTPRSKDRLLSISAKLTRSWSSLSSGSRTGDRGVIQRSQSGRGWGDVLDLISHRKTEALATENFENTWEKGRNYRKKEATEPIQQNSSTRSSNLVDNSKALASHIEKCGSTKGNKLLSEYSEQSAMGNLLSHGDHNRSKPLLGTSYEEESRSISCYSSEDEKSSQITGLGSPGTKVWDGKSNRNISVIHIHHPLESFGGQKTRKTGKCCSQPERLPEIHPEKRSEVSSRKEQVWLEVGRTSFSLRDGQDVLSSIGDTKSEDSSDDSEAEPSGRNYSTSGSSSFSSISMPESTGLAINAQKGSQLDDSFLRLRCEVLGANVVKSGSKTFAVYSISVTDVNNVSWSIKRRFQHFEELHRRLKEYAEYNLHIPPKHFLSSGLDMPVIQERCKLLDIYLKRLVQFPTISGSIEVWDFLSVDSQTYGFSDSISIIETLSFNRDTTLRERSTEVIQPVRDPLTSTREHSDVVMKDSSLQMKHNSSAEGSRKSTKNVVLALEKPAKELGNPSDDSASDSESFAKHNTSSTRELTRASKGTEDEKLHAPSQLLMDDSDPILPSEWVPPNLSAPILDLVEVVFKLQDGDWIRRKAFWVAKQVLQLGMSDAFDDWLIEKIQLLRRGSIIASGIRRFEQILWPDGIFITKHPKRQQPTPSPRELQMSPNDQPQHPPNDEKVQKQEDQRRSKLVYELMIEKAPAAMVGLVGRKQYEQCAKDLYYFIQSSVCLKQLAFDLLELLLVSAFPELNCVFRQVHDEKHRFGIFEQD